MSEQRPYHHGDLARALEMAARQSIETGGADSLSLRGLARALGVDPAATYRHFKSKDDLLVQVAVTGFNELGLAMQGAVARQQDEKARLVEAGMAYMSYGMRHPKLFALMFDLAGRAPAARLAERVEINPYEIFLGTVHAALPEMTPERRDLAIAHLWSNVHGAVGLANQGLLFRDETAELRGARRMCEAVVDLLVTM